MAFRVVASRTLLLDSRRAALSKEVRLTFGGTNFAASRRQDRSFILDLRERSGVPEAAAKRRR
jgi:hypothetical protein